MEKLAGNLTSELLPAYPPKNLYLCSSATIEALVSQIPRSFGHFGLFLAMDAKSVDTDGIGHAAEKLFEKGLAYLSAWGPDCERVHDIFDEIAVEMDPDLKNGVVLTTWHADEPLQEALWFFVNSAFPDQAYERTCNDWVVAPIGHPEWEQLVRDEIKSHKSDQSS